MRVLVILLCLALSGAAFAQRPPRAAAKPIELGEVDRADVARVERYLGEVTTVRAQFVQVSSTGEQGRGTFYLRRGEGLRVEYDPPNPILLVGTRSFLIYVDRELEQESYIDIDSTPIAFLLSRDPTLTKDLFVTAIQRTPGALRLGLARKDEPGAGTIELVFADRPLALRQWVVTDARGVETRVGLIDPVFGPPLDPKLFEYTPKKKEREQR